MSVRSRFCCPHCKLSVCSNLSALLLWVVPVSILGEFAFLMLLGNVFGDSVAFYIWFFIGGIAGVLIYWFAIFNLAKLSPVS